MLVQAQLEVHAHDGEVVAAGAQRQVERAGAYRFGRLEQAEDRLGIAKDVGWPDETAHRPPHTEHGDFRTDGGRGALGIGKLLAGPNRAEGNIVGHHQADRRFDLFRRGAQNRAVRSGRADGAVDDMIDLVVLQREDFGQSSANFVQQDHGPQGLSTVETAELRGGHCHRIEVVVAELSFGSVAGRVVAEVRAVGVPLAHRGAVGHHGFLGHHLGARSEHRYARVVGVFERFGSQHGGSIGAAGQRRHAASDAIEVKLLDPGVDAVGRSVQLAGHEVDRVASDAKRLVFGPRKFDEFVGHAKSPWQLTRSAWSRGKAGG